ncbi:MAG: DUF4124 domain-containing protein [Gammaproteobacteria bacterium]|nr:DUF4124 domain-containing protein [Gammaproteobacteria bacterium]
MLLAIIAFCGAHAADEGDRGNEEKKIYRSTDEHGNAVFSDQNTPDAAEVHVEETATMPSDALNAEYRAVFGDDDDGEEGEDTGFTSYASLAITAPPNDQPIRANNGNVRIAFNIQPAALGEHRIELMMDGNPIREVTGSGSVVLEHMDRGTHQASLRVTHRDSGEVIQQGPVQTFTVMRHSILN